MDKKHDVLLCIGEVLSIGKALLCRRNNPFQDMLLLETNPLWGGVKNELHVFHSPLLHHYIPSTAHVVLLESFYSEAV